MKQTAKYGTIGRMNQNPSNPHPFKPENEAPQQSTFWETVKFVFIAIVIVVPIRMFVAQPFVVHGESMDPTFDDKQYLIVDEISYHVSQPKRGDVSIIRYPQNPKLFFIKRVIGLPGETINIEGSIVTIYNDEYPEGFVLDEPYVEFITNNRLEKKIGEGEYFVMGDNRAKSSDSRIWGTVPKKYMVGRALIRLLPFNALGFLPGETNFDK
ncbi:MAG: signal peptidase I [Candidatus Paceibacteria bacterium]